MELKSQPQWSCINITIRIKLDISDRTYISHYVEYEGGYKSWSPEMYLKKEMF